MENIEKMIADARAEEEVKKEQEKTRREDAFRRELKAKLSEVVGKSPKVEIPLDEYSILKAKEMDLTRLLVAIADDLKLNYSKDDLRLDGERTLNTFRALYSDAYDAILDEVKEGE